MSQNEQNKNALILYRRVMRIDYLVSLGTYPDWKDLNEDDDIRSSRASIMRTIEFMRDSLHIPIDWDRTKKGYYYKNKYFRMPMQYMTQEQQKAVHILDAYSEKLKKTPVYESVKTVIGLFKDNACLSTQDDKCLGAQENPEFDYRVDTGLSWMNGRFVVMNDDSFKEMDPSVFAAIQNAMQSNAVVSFNYNFPGTKKSSPLKCRVSPYQIVFNDSQWFLWGFEHDKKEKKPGSKNGRNRLFFMSKIENVEILREKFTLPEKFNYLELRSKENGLIDDVMGISKNDRVDCKVRVSPKKAEYAKEVFKKTKIFTLKEQKDGCVILKFRRSKDNLKSVRRRIFAEEEWGDEVTPLEPEELVNEWNNIPELVDNLSMKYKKSLEYLKQHGD